MKYVMFVALGLLIICGVVGCATLGMTKEDTAMVRELRDSWVDMANRRAASLVELKANREAAYEQIAAQKKAIMDDLDAGIISIDKAEKLIALVEREGEFTLSKIKDEIEEIEDDFDEQQRITDARIRELEAKGYKWWQVVGALLGSFGSGLLIDRKKLTGVVTG